MYCGFYNFNSVETASAIRSFGDYIGCRIKELCRNLHPRNGKNSNGFDEAKRVLANQKP